MKKITLALMGSAISAGLALAGGSAYAADLMAPPPAAAVVTTSGGGYISVFGGYALPMTVTGTYTTNNATFSAPFGGGYIVGGAIGTHLGDNARIEGELSYASRAVSGNISATPPGATLPTTGNEATLYLLGNVWLDLNTRSGFTPYIGGGVGAAALMPNITFAGAPGGTYNTASFAPAVQLGAGVKFDVSDNMSVDLGYRAKYVFNATVPTAAGGPDGSLAGVSYLDQAVQIGLNFGF